MKNYINYNFFKAKKLSIEHGEGKTIDIELSPFSLKSTNINIKREFIEKLKNFIITMNENCPSFDLEQFQKNFKQMQFKLYKDKQNKASVVIFLRKKCKIYNIDSIYHELMHLSSIRVSGAVEYCGLSESYYVYGDSFGMGLNEGYTQLLKIRYFGEDTHSIYPIETKIASLIEQIIGKDNMENCFFNANLRKFCEILQKYNSANETKRFINKLDKLHEYMKNLDTNIKIQELYTDISLFLLECLKNKSELEDIDLSQTINLLFDTKLILTYTNKQKLTLNGLTRENRINQKK